jgi:hypothetical protein
VRKITQVAIKNLMATMSPKSKVRQMSHWHKCAAQRKSPSKINGRENQSGTNVPPLSGAAAAVEQMFQRQIRDSAKSMAREI